MANTSEIRPRMEVVGSTGGYVGVVDVIEGTAIRLAHEDPAPSAGGQYHYVPLDWVASVDESVHLNKPYDEVMHAWRTASASPKQCC